MTMTASETRTSPWTLDELDGLPEDGSRHEIIEGSLLVSPAPALPHFYALTYFQRLLIKHAPDDFAVGQNVGVLRHGAKQTYLIPDLVVVNAERGRKGKALLPAELLLVVEALSPDGASMDTVMKRLHYARMGIPQYWIVDPEAAELTVLRGRDGDHYREEIRVKAGERWETDDPFPLALDPADFC
jgi:Uma2 family endonuclease